MSTKFDSTYSAVVSLAEQLIGEGKYDSTYSAVLAIYQNLTSDVDTKFDSVYSIVVTIADGIESGDIDLGGGGDCPDCPENPDCPEFITQILTQTITKNGTYNYTPTTDGYSQVDIVVDVEIPEFTTETLTETLTTNGTYNYTPTTDGFSSVDIVVDVEIPEFTTETLTETLTTNGTYNYTPTTDGFSSVDIVVNVEGGGSGSDEPINYNTHKFYNMNGELVEEWTLEETQSKTELPVVSDLSGGDHMILFDGWNWDLEQLKSASCGQNIGAIYRPSDGKTRIVIEIDEDDTNLYQLLGVGETTVDAIINWGDGVEESLSLFPNHTYSEPGTYIISIDGGVSFRFSDSSLSQTQWNGMPYWYYNSRIKRIFCGNNVGTLDFGYCTGVDKVVFTGDTVSVTSTTFTETKSLKYLAIPKGVTIYPKTGKSIEVISMPYGVTSIGGYAFEYYSSLQSVNIPDSVTRISSGAFEQCASLQSINIPDRVTSIGQQVFKQCYSLQSINIPDRVNSIGSSVFSGCYSLQSVNIPVGVTSIDIQAFYECYSLQSIIIPDGVTSIGDSVFGNCRSLQSINIPDGVTSLGERVFNTCSSLQSVTIPDGVTSISNYSFSNCYSLQSITIPNSVTSIGNQAFYNCTYITIDFSDCTQVPTLSSTNAFNSTALILVPESLYDEWISATNWSSLSSQIIAV